MKIRVGYVVTEKVREKEKNKKLSLVDLGFLKLIPYSFLSVTLKSHEVTSIPTDIFLRYLVVLDDFMIMLIIDCTLKGDRRIRTKNRPW